jgi:IS30 family transposase
LRQIGAEMGCSHMTVSRELGSRLPVAAARAGWEPGGNRLGLAEREEISLGVAQGESFTAMAARLGRSVSTVSREVNHHGGRGGYRAAVAHRQAFDHARRPKTTKLSDPRLAGLVTEWLLEFWSPLAIAGRLRVEFPHDPMMWVSHETIYQTLFVQGRGELRAELNRCLRSGRSQRRPQGRLETRGRIPGMVMISDRPAEVADRAVPGHWEGDLIIGKNSRSAVGTLVERTSRYTLLMHLPDNHDAVSVDAAMRKAIQNCPASSSAPSPGTKASRWPATPPSASTPASRSTSATRTAPGSGPPTKTPMGSSANTCPKAPTCPPTAKTTSTASPAASTTDPAAYSDI